LAALTSSESTEEKGPSRKEDEGNKRKKRKKRNIGTGIKRKTNM
jgi:hypothetical protein